MKAIRIHVRLLSFLQGEQHQGLVPRAEVLLHVRLITYLKCVEHCKSMQRSKVMFSRQSLHDSSV